MHDEAVKVMQCFFKQSIMKEAEDMCGKKGKHGARGGGSVWWNEEVQKAVENRRKAFMKSLHKIFVTGI